MRSNPSRKAKTVAVANLKRIAAELAVESDDDGLNWDVVSTWENGVVVRPSKIQNAGFGLFAARRFEPNDVITEYTGEVITKAKVAKLSEANDFLYVAQMPPFYIDGFRYQNVSQLRGGCGSMANDPRNPEENNCTLYTTAFKSDVLKKMYRTGIQTPKRLWLLATQSIQPGDEILYSYGKRYWHRFDAAPVAKWERSFQGSAKSTKRKH